MQKLLSTLIFFSIAAFTFSQNYQRDVVYLKNGSIIKGNIIEQIPDKQVKVETAGGSIFVYEMEEVEKIKKEEVSELNNKIPKTQDYLSPVKQGKIVISGASELSFVSQSREQKFTINGYYNDEENITSETDINEFNFNTSIGYFIYDGLALGASLSYESTVYEYENSTEKETTIMAGPNLTYFIGSSNIKPYLFGEYMFGSSNVEYTEDDSTNDSKVALNGWALGAGLAVFMNQHISLNLALGYTEAYGDPENDDSSSVTYGKITTSAFALNGGISVYF